MLKPLVCKPLTWNFKIPNNNSVLCHTFCDQNVSKDSTFAVNPCTSDCTGVSFKFCTFFNFPSSASIISHCPLVTVLCICTSKLSQIQSEDLKGFDNLKELYIEVCKIEHLPGDLFKHTKKLEIISFYGNKIKTVGDGLLAPVRSLKYFNLGHNTGISYCFSTYTKTGTLEELKAKLKEMKTYSELCMDLEAKKKEIAALKMENGTVKARCTTLENQLRVSKDETNAIKAEMKSFKVEFKKSRESTEKKIETLMMQMQQMQETAINFVVKVNDKEFKVNKLLLKTHSKALETLINANPESDSLELTDVSVAVFEEVLMFMKTGNPPKENVDLVELFGAACRLEIKALIQITARLLQQKVNPETALKVLILCNKYKDHAQLKAKAFDEFNKNFPHFTIKAEIASNPEKLKQFWQAKQQMDQVLLNN